MSGKNGEKNNRREIFGWLTYDWANSAFFTTVVTVLAGPYLTALAQADVDLGGIVLSLGPFGSGLLSLVPNSLRISGALSCPREVGDRRTRWNANTGTPA